MPVRTARSLGLLACALFVVLGLGLAPRSVSAEPLKIVYSDWPGWVTWEIAIQKKWDKEAGLDLQFLWMDYVAGMDAFAAGQADAVSMTNGDALVMGAKSGKPSVAILINDYSNGNDMVIAKPGLTNALGCLVADVHRLLLGGGIYLYPGEVKKPEGKLRLLYEANPMAMVVEQAGGKASNGVTRILDIEPNTLHQRVPLVIGSADDVRDAESYIQGKKVLS